MAHDREMGFVWARVLLGCYTSPMEVKHLFTWKAEEYYLSHIFCVSSFPRFIIKYIFVNLRDYNVFIILIKKLLFRILGFSVFLNMFIFCLVERKRKSAIFPW